MNRKLLIAFRLFQAIFMTSNLTNPDAYWQGTEVAYSLAYGGVELPWEWIPQYRIRSTIYPFYLYSYLWVIKTLGLDFAIVIRVYPYIA